MARTAITMHGTKTAIITKMIRDLLLIEPTPALSRKSMHVMYAARRLYSKKIPIIYDETHFPVTSLH